MVMQGIKSTDQIATQVPVAEGSLAPLSGIKKAQIADFVHGADGFGNTGQLPAKVPGNAPHCICCHRATCIFLLLVELKLRCCTYVALIGIIDFQAPPSAILWSGSVKTWNCTPLRPQACTPSSCLLIRITSNSHASQHAAVARGHPTVPVLRVPVQGQPVQLSAAMFICEMVAAHPGRVTLLALASLTNVAMAMKHEPTLAANLVRHRTPQSRRVSGRCRAHSIVKEQRQIRVGCIESGGAARRSPRMQKSRIRWPCKGSTRCAVPKALGT